VAARRTSGYGVWSSAQNWFGTPQSDRGVVYHRTAQTLYGGPCEWVEGAVDGGLGDIGEAEVVVAGVGPQPGESLGQIDVGAF
jgi:hypothetical protein